MVFFNSSRKRIIFCWLSCVETNQIQNMKQRQDKVKRSRDVGVGDSIFGLEIDVDPMDLKDETRFSRKTPDQLYQEMVLAKEKEEAAAQIGDSLDPMSLVQLTGGGEEQNMGKSLRSEADDSPPHLENLTLSDVPLSQQLIFFHQYFAEEDLRQRWRQAQQNLRSKRPQHKLTLSVIKPVPPPPPQKTKKENTTKAIPLVFLPVGGDRKIGSTPKETQPVQLQQPKSRQQMKDEEQLREKQRKEEEEKQKREAEKKAQEARLRKIEDDQKRRADDLRRKVEERAKEQAKQNMRCSIDRSSSDWVSLYRRVQKGENVCVTGQSGTGKTSYALTLAEVCRDTLSRRVVLISGAPNETVANRLRFLVRADLPVCSWASLMSPFLARFERRCAEERQLAEAQPSQQSPPAVEEKLVLGEEEELAEFRALCGLDRVVERWLQAEVWVIDDLQGITYEEFQLACSIANIVRNQKSKDASDTAEIKHKRAFGGLQLVVFADFGHVSAKKGMDVYDSVAFEQAFLAEEKKTDLEGGHNEDSDDENDNKVGGSRMALRKNLAMDQMMWNTTSWCRGASQQAKEKTDEALQALEKTKRVGSEDQLLVWLTSTGKRAHIYNMAKLARVSQETYQTCRVWKAFAAIHKERRAPCSDVTAEGRVDELLRDALWTVKHAIPTELKLCMGAQVMLTEACEGHAPGEVGTVQRFETESNGGASDGLVFPIVFFPSLKTNLRVLARETRLDVFSASSGNKKIPLHFGHVTVLQLPLVLAWSMAITDSVGLRLPTVGIALCLKTEPLPGETKLMEPYCPPHGIYSALTRAPGAVLRGWKSGRHTQTCSQALSGWNDQQSH